MSTASWRDFLETSTIHGLGEIVRSKGTPERVFFIASLLVCNVFSFYGVYQIVRQYSVRPVATSFFVNEADKLQLPDVTICPFNRLDKDFLVAKDISDDLSKYIEWSFFPVNPQYDFVDFKIRQRAKTNIEELSLMLEEKLSLLNMTFENLMHKAVIPCENFVKSCEQQYQKFNCCANAKPILTGFGKCYRIPGRDQHGPGFGTGMTLILNLPLERLTTSENMLMNDGVMIKLTEPNKGYEYDAIFIPTGVHALLQLRATQLDFMNDPPRYRCRKEEPGSNYAPLLCYQKCLLREPHLNCSCRYIGLPIDDIDDKDGTSQLPACKPKQLLRCVYMVLAQIYRADPNFALRCKERCESRCNYWQYQATVSYAKYPSFTLAQNYPFFNEAGSPLSNREMIEDRMSREIVLELFYDKLEYTLIKHFPSMTADQFIANIGGQMGLWMGGSILSIIHLLVFLCLFSREKTQRGAEAVIKTAANQKKRRASSAPSKAQNTTAIHDPQNNMLCPDEEYSYEPTQNHAPNYTINNFNNIDNKNNNNNTNILQRPRIRKPSRNYRSPDQTYSTNGEADVFTDSDDAYPYHEGNR